MTEPPTENLTFLFTDIVGSTRLWEQFPEQMQQAHTRHTQLIAACVERQQGCLVRERGEGDSTFSVFANALDATIACCAFQRALQAEAWPPNAPIAVRAALHTGHAHLYAGDYNSTDVNRCARLRAVSHGGQILVSARVCQAVQAHLPSDISLRDMGLHRLKDLRDPEHIFQLCHAEMRADFPPLQSLDNWPNNLPRQISSFIGRTAEMQTVRGLLQSHPLVTLTGTGGAGKTRLALQIGAELLPRYAGGVWFVELAALSNHALVPHALLTVLGLIEETGHTAAQTLVEYLEPRAVLLLLDNCEHLIQACASLADVLLRACPGLTILATSREPLGISGEHAWRVPSLQAPIPLPDKDKGPAGKQDAGKQHQEKGYAGKDPKEPKNYLEENCEEKDIAAVLLEYDAVRLFVERARAHQPEFTLTRRNAPAVTHIVQQLDGIPFALELAAARCRSLPVELLATRLQDRFRLLTGGSRAALPRQQTLRALIDWSYDLLTEAEKTLLRRVSVFAGGWTLEAAETVCAGGALEAWEILDLLEKLDAKSLLIYEPSGNDFGQQGPRQPDAPPQMAAGRYRQLETIRQYAREKTEERAEPEEAEPLRARHAACFLSVAEQAKLHYADAQQTHWFRLLEWEHDNMRAALRFSLDAPHRAQTGMRLAAALARFWWTRGYMTQGRVWTAEALGAADAATPPLLYAEVLHEAGIMAAMQGDYPSAEGGFQKCLTLRREHGDAVTVAGVLRSLGALMTDKDDQAQARRYLEEGLELLRELQDKRGAAGLLGTLGIVAAREHDPQSGRRHMEESLALLRELGDTQGAANTLHNLGVILHEQGDVTAAQRCYVEALEQTLEMGNKLYLVCSLEVLASVAEACRQWERAIRLFGAAHGHRDRTTEPLPPAYLERDDTLARLRSTAGGARYEQIFVQGYAMPLDEAIAYALTSDKSGSLG